MTSLTLLGPKQRVAFETRDLGIFSIPDPRTRLDALQRYFFPRLDAVLAAACGTAFDVYGYQAMDRMTITRRPKHSPSTRARDVVDSGRVWTGLTPKRKSFALKTRKASGEPYQIGPSFLLIELDPRGGLQVRFQPFVWADSDFREATFRAVRKAWSVVRPVLQRHRFRAEVLPSEPDPWPSPDEALRTAAYVDWTGPLWHFPLATGPWMDELVAEFVAMYAILEATTSLAIGDAVRLERDLARFLIWSGRRDSAIVVHEDRDIPPSDVDDLLGDAGGYRSLRPGAWYHVLQRDLWKCLSCGRGVAQGVLLEVDHIKPRSRGGSNALENLQTLCKKCNIGKSNRDDTDLRLPQ